MSKHTATFPFPSDAFVRDDLIGTFGKREMELAAKRIIKIAHDDRTWAMQLCEDDFDTSHSSYELDGFLDLIENGWLKETDKDRYEVSLDFLQRLKKRRPQYF
jgi:hypothetical protein